MTVSDPTDVHALEEARAAQAEQEVFLRRIEADDMKWLMSDKRGRRIMHRLLARTRVHHNPFVAGRGDLTSFQCGVLNVGLQYNADLHEFCPERIATMLTENK